MKKCSHCKIEKNLNCFLKNKSRKDGLQHTCKKCAETYRKDHKEKIKQQKKQYYLENKEHIQQQHRQYKIVHKKQIKNYIKQYEKDHKEEIKQKKKQYCLENKKEISDQQKQYYKTHKQQKKQYATKHRKEINKYRKEKLKIDINFKIACNLRSRLSDALKNNQKSGSAIRDLGCTIEEFKKWKSIDFPRLSVGSKQYMCWNNYGKLWHIDHIIPLSLFDLTDPVQFKKAVHYSNLQPMWASENLSKGNR